MRIAIALTLLVVGACWAVTLPVECDFSWDTPGQAPLTGGPHQPSYLVLPGSGSILVQAAALGLNEQPCVIDQDGNDAYGGISFTFDPIDASRLVFEATISLNEYCNSYLMQTSAYSGAVATRLRILDNGQIIDFFQTPLGEYTPGQPFRCRMAVDMIAKTWDCTLDDEMNGFEDDPVIADLPFVNDESIITDISRASASLGHVYNGTAQVAYDVITIQVEIVGTGQGSWSSVKRIY